MKLLSLQVTPRKVFQIRRNLIKSSMRSLWSKMLAKDRVVSQTTVRKGRLSRRQSSVAALWAKIAIIDLAIALQLSAMLTIS